MSRDPGPLGQDPYSTAPFWRTPGSLGRNDAAELVASPWAFRGRRTGFACNLDDSPGPLGMNDRAVPVKPPPTYGLTDAEFVGNASRSSLSDKDYEEAAK